MKTRVSRCERRIYKRIETLVVFWPPVTRHYYPEESTKELKLWLLFQFIVSTLRIERVEPRACNTSINKLARRLAKYVKSAYAEIKSVVEAVLGEK